MKQYRNYLFDADGTLFDTVDLICRCFQYTSRKYTGREMSRREILAGYGLPLTGQLHKLIGDEGDLDRVLDDYMNFQLEILESSIAPFPGVVETLETLKQAGMTTAIVTSRRRHSMDRILEATDTARYFDIVVTPEDTVRHKPDAEPTLLAMKKLQAEREHTVFTGDAQFDIQSGSSAGIDTVFVTWSHAELSSLPVQPTWTIDAMEDLTAVFAANRINP